jgi:hypothetical protein
MFICPRVEGVENKKKKKKKEKKRPSHRGEDGRKAALAADTPKQEHEQVGYVVG